MISQYWVGQIPTKALSIQVKDSAGNDANLAGYPNVSVKMLGSRNEEIDLSGSTVSTGSKELGIIGFIWPTDRSLFTYPGDYVLQLELAGTDRKDFTSTHTIRVKKLGSVAR